MRPKKIPKPKASKPRFRIGPRKKKIAELKSRLQQLQGRKRYLEIELKKQQDEYRGLVRLLYFGGFKAVSAEHIEKAKKGNKLLDACSRSIEATTKNLGECEGEISRINSRIAEMEKRIKWPLVTWKAE